MQRTQGFPNTQAAAARGIRQRQLEQVVFAVVLGHAKNNPASMGASSVTPAVPEPSWVPAKTTSSIGEGVPCGGDLPTCAIVDRESHGTWGAFNPTGCGGSGCFGPYQFSGAWAGKLGLPSDLTTTTHDQWVNAARALWNHGAGCSNWSC